MESITTHFNNDTLEKLKNISQPWAIPPFTTDPETQSEEEKYIKMAIDSGYGSHMKKVQNYLKKNNVFLDYHSGRIVKLEKMGLVLHIIDNKIPGTSPLGVYFCPLPFDLAKYFYHYYQLVFEGDVTNRFFTNSIESITGYKCDIFNNEYYKELHSDPQFINAFCDTLKDMNLLKMHTGSGICANQEEQSEINEKGIVKCKNFWGDENRYHLVVNLSTIFMNYEF